MKKPATAPAPVSRAPKRPAPPAIHYLVELADVHAHLFRVTLTVARPAAQQQLSLPVWIPGSYLVREFSKNLQHLQARQGKAATPIEQLDKCTWQADSLSGKPLVVTYEVYAGDNSVRTACLDAMRGFFNGTSLCLKVHGQESAPHVLELAPQPLLSSWSVATGLTAEKVNKKGFGRYVAGDYDELVDCPVEMGDFWSGSFHACGVPHRFVVAGALPGFDGDKLLADTRKICEAQIRFWHGSKKPPFNNYLFMLNAVDEGYGGLEHRNSTALVCKRADLPRTALAGSPASTRVSDGYTTLRGLVSHEYFHAWNVKRLRPAAFENYDYSRENYTAQLWFFEGFTSYYDDLFLRRTGLLDNTGYLKLLNKTINQVMQTPGRLVQSVAQASFDAWVKYYRQDENTPNATVSYYTKGSLVALCLDLTLRAEGKAGADLDKVMHELWVRCKAGPMSEADFAAALEAVGKRSFAAELASWVHGRDELPLKLLLEQHGVAVHEDPAQLAHRLGMRVSESAGLQVKTVLRGGVAEKAGFAPGDEWLAVEPVGPRAAAPGSAGWRMSQLDDLLAYAGNAKTVSALVARDKRLLRLELPMPPTLTTWRLAVRDAAKIDTWLQPAANDQPV
ncbi:MAG: peptidase [Polaromonas sp.]|nr:peptidase [Polaromonas sp.]